jgi:hypothetical protein
MDAIALSCKPLLHWRRTMFSTTLPYHRKRHSRRSLRRPLRRRLELELLEARNLLDGGLANVLVNDPTLDTTAQDTQSETAIVLGAGSKVIVAYNDSGVFSADNPAFTGYSTSANGGASFTDKGSLPLNHDVGDPVLARSSKTGTIFLSTIGVDSAYVNPPPPPPGRLSGREHFHDPVNGTPGFVANVDVQDKPWIAVDNFPGPGYGNVYLVNYHVSTSPTFHFDIHLTRSTDDGLTWGPSGGTVITSTDQLVSIQGANVTVGPDHAVYVFWWDQTKGQDNSFNAQILMCKSTDQGVTFGDPVTVTTLETPYIGGNLLLTDSGGHYFSTNAFPQAVVNPVTGDIYVAFNDRANGSQQPKDKGNIYFTQSSDGGQKWSKPVQVNDDLTTNDQWFPALAVTPDGSHVGLFWYDRRLDPANNLIDRFGAIGTVSGHTVTFGANFRITDVSFPPVFTYWTGSAWHIQDPVIRPGYMGDYDQAVADNDYFYTTWGDNRLADAFHANQPDVRFAKVPVGWAGTVSALAALAGPAGALASRPAVAESTPFVVPSGAVAPSDPAQVAALWTDVRRQPAIPAPPRYSRLDAFFALMGPPAAHSAGTAPALIAAAPAVTEPGALLSSEAKWKGLAGDAYFTGRARTSKTTDGLTNGDTAPSHTFVLAAPALPGATDQIVPPPARVSGTLTSALARRAPHGLAEDWATDVLTLADPSWDTEAAAWPAG